MNNSIVEVGVIFVKERSKVLKIQYIILNVCGHSFFWLLASVGPAQFNFASFSGLAGVSNGAILVFDVPSKGSNITLSEVLEEHKEPITDMASECSGSQVRWGRPLGSLFVTQSSWIRC